MPSTVGGTTTRVLNRIDKRPASLTLTFSVADRSQAKQAGIYMSLHVRAWYVQRRKLKESKGQGVRDG